MPSIPWDLFTGIIIEKTFCLHVSHGKVLGSRLIKLRFYKIFSDWMASIKKKTFLGKLAHPSSQASVRMMYNHGSISGPGTICGFVGGFCPCSKNFSTGSLVFIP